MTAVRRGLTDRFAALPRRRQERLQDAGLAVALAAVNVTSLLPYRAELHPLWLALLLVIGQAVPLTWRRSQAIGAGLVIGVCRVSYDTIGFGFAPFPLGPAIIVYTVFDQRGVITRWFVGGILAAGIWVSQASPGHSEPYDTIFQVLIFAGAAGAGLLSRTMRSSLAVAQRRADRAEAELDEQASRAAAAERARIARELHDVVAHHVSLMAVQAEAAGALLPGRPAEAATSVGVISDTARTALTELRRLLGVLRGPTQHLDTAPAASMNDLRELLATVRDAGLPVDLEIVGTPATLAPGVELTAFRIVQEGLTNTLRHSGAGRAGVTIRYEPGFVTLSVADCGPLRGSGQDAADGRERPRPGLVPGGPGFGLAGIAERVASCGGSLTVGPTAAAGFALTARLPTT
jgi:signal transduction histidine kinase